MKRVFLDTNIIIDVLEHRDPSFIQSANLLELGYRKKIHFPDSESVMVLTPQEFFDCFSDELKW